MRGRLTFLVLSAASLVACVSPPAERPVVGRISALPALQHPADNPTSPAKVALGAQLFMDKRLSGSGNNNCQSCHYRELGWTDAKPLSRKDDGSMNTRHTPSLYNVGHQSLWYWDGRATTLEGQITADRARRVKARLVLEGANGPTVPAADDILADRGILVVPDVICNAGGVTVSYFEWVQDFSSFFWTEDEINVRLDKIMIGALKKIWDTADKHQITLRTATFAVACERILIAREERGLYP